MRVYFRVHGVVQGIGYRWFTRDAAAGHGLTGLVRNLGDGSVEGEVQGEKVAVEIFLRQLKTGHPYAEVKRVETAGLKDRERETDFIIDHSELR